MKKIKNLFLMAIFTICSFAIIGTVNAAGQASSPKVICIPDTLEVGDTSTCYFIANISGEVDGFITKVYAMDGLLIDDTAKDVNVGKGTNAKKIILDHGKETEVKDGIKHKCDTAGEKVANGKNIQQFCAIFHSGEFKNGNYDKDDKDDTISDDYKDLAVIASFKVRLDENLNTCGRICISSKFVPSYANGESASITYANPSSPGTDTPCAEIEPKNPVNAGTGAFASYSILIAGAVVAIVSISIAKKQKKIFNV